MTARALAKKVKRLETLAALHPSRNDAAALCQRVALPSIEAFVVLPVAEQKRLVSAWRPSPRDVDLPTLEEFEKLSVAERKRLLAEALGPPDSTFSACFRCLPLKEQVNLCLQRSPGPLP